MHYRIVHELSAPPLVDLSRLVLALDHHGRRLDQLIEPAQSRGSRWRVRRGGGYAFDVRQKKSGKNVPRQVECREDDAQGLRARGALRLAQRIA